MEEFRSWRLQSILMAELTAGNTLYKSSVANGAEDTAALFILNKPFMTAIRPDRPPVSFKEITTDPICFERAYFDEETKEILAFRVPQTPITDLKNIIRSFRRK